MIILTAGWTVKLRGIEEKMGKFVFRVKVIKDKWWIGIRGREECREREGEGYVLGIF